MSEQGYCTWFNHAWGIVTSCGHQWPQSDQMTMRIGTYCTFCSKIMQVEKCKDDSLESHEELLNKYKKVLANTIRIERNKL